MKHPVLACLASLLAVAVLWPAAVNADVLGTGRGTWTAWVSPTAGSGAFWDNVSPNGHACDAALWASGTGNCDSPISGFYRDGASGSANSDDWYEQWLKVPKTGKGIEFTATDGLGSTKPKAADDGELLSALDEGLPVPEPATLVLLGSGLLGIGAAVRRRRARTSL
jgi:hypothetical protein